MKGPVGRGIPLGKVVATLALVMVVATPLLFEFRKHRMDREVDRLCAVDGGVHIYEPVTLAASDFGPNGEVFPQYAWLPPSRGRYGESFYETAERQTLHDGDPSLTKTVVRFVRRKDEKVLAEAINYVRGGGDLPGPWGRSTHQCAEYLNPKRPLISVFVRGN